MKNFTLIHETPDHFVLHNGKSHFHIAKNGIDVPTADKIRALAEGGKIKKDTDLTPPPPANLDYTPQPLPTPEPQPKRRQIEATMPEPEAYAQGGKLDANARSHIAPHNFALPNGRYPIHDENHARNALARVSQHGTPEEKAKVRAAVHKKYPGIAQSYDDGGQVPPPPIDPDKAQSAQDSMRKAFGYSEGGPTMAAPQQESTPDPTPTPIPAANPEVTAAIRGAFGQRNPASVKKAGGGAIASNEVKDISHETQTQAIGRYAAGNPANLANGGATHYSQGKYHFHFYDAPDYSSKQPEQPPTPLDQETRQNYAGTSSDPSASVVEPDSVQLSAADIPTESNPTPAGPITAPPSEVQQEIDAAAATPSPEESANNLAGAMGQQQPFQQAQPSTTPSSGQTVAPQNQIPLAVKNAPPKQELPLKDQFDANNKIIAKSVENDDLATAKGFEARNEILSNQINQQQKMYEDYRTDQYNNTVQNNELYKNILASKVDPSRYWTSKGPFGKVLAGIGLVLGGASSGLTGRSNPALDVIQNAIKEDINAQMNDQSKAMNLYKMGLDRYKDRNSAYQFAQMYLNTATMAQIQKQANTTNSQIANNNAKAASAVLGNQNMQIREQLGLTDSAMKAMNGPQTAQQGGVDQNKSFLLTRAGIIPKEEQSAVDKESDDYEKLRNVLNHTDDVFSTLSQNANYRQRISDALPLGSHIPTVAAASKNYEAVAKDWLGNITKETEGRVTPTDVELMRPGLPQVGDPPETAAIKINNIKDQIREKYAFNTLHKYRLLSPNDSISSLSSARRKRFNESPVK